MQSITIQQVFVGTSEYRQVYELRNELLRKPLGLSLDNEDLGQDEHDIILAAFGADDIAGCLMLTHKDNDTVKFRQMAVAQQMQGQGIGRMLLLEAQRICTEKQYRKVVLHARATAAEFYARMGYTITSGLFTEVGIPHYVMEKEIG